MNKHESSRILERKPESLKAEGLCAVRSSKAARLTHIKAGYYHPPGAPIFVWRNRSQNTFCEHQHE